MTGQSSTAERSTAQHVVFVVACGCYLCSLVFLLLLFHSPFSSFSRCYGPSQNTVSAGSISLAGTDVSVWFHAQAEFSWGVAQSRGQCLPVFRQHSPVNQLQVYFNYTSGIADPAVFNPPPECHRSHVQAWKVAQGSDLKAVRALAASLPRSRRAGGIKAAQAASAAASAAAAAASSTPKRHHRHSSNAALAAALAEPLQRINKRTQQKQQGGH
jgi:hypothetical protein